ncbi:hypothetical protein RFI_22760 [Reticulomyxa filosa]|uniref:Uncharacterized protein n=1 Tax=Reticulomyxa filosa TaxID=46433 RepID=X6MLR9_RETFI|nr:hypothetical protein RFI_22760 [Reticulomyxa filosa]|eukprot:ETO14606.1 hypothetical protein RFI_22760 [Reticulomyxa filosa]
MEVEMAERHLPDTRGEGEHNDEDEEANRLQDRNKNREEMEDEQKAVILPAKDNSTPITDALTPANSTNEKDNSPVESGSSDTTKVASANDHYVYSNPSSSKRVEHAHAANKGYNSAVHATPYRNDKDVVNRYHIAPPRKASSPPSPFLNDEKDEPDEHANGNGGDKDDDDDDDDNDDNNERKEMKGQMYQHHFGGNLDAKLKQETAMKSTASGQSLGIASPFGLKQRPVNQLELPATIHFGHVRTDSNGSNLSEKIWGDKDAKHDENVYVPNKESDNMFLEVILSFPFSFLLWFEKKQHFGDDKTKTNLGQTPSRPQKKAYNVMIADRMMNSIDVENPFEKDEPLDANDDNETVMSQESASTETKATQSIEKKQPRHPWLSPSNVDASKTHEKST